MSDSMTFAEMQENGYAIQGIPLVDHMRRGDFVSTVWMMWTGAEPTPAEKQIIEQCFIASIDHGQEPPSAHVARVVGSAGKPLADAVAAGLLTLGPRHGNAGGTASLWVREVVASAKNPETFVDEMLAEGKRIAGLGHPIYDIDPRTTVIFETARAVLANTAHVTMMENVARILTERKGKPMPINVDGAIGAVLADLGAPADLADAIFLCGRAFGLVAHAREEIGTTKSYRRALAGT